MRGLYKGLASPLIGNCFINAILFGCYGNLLKQFNNPGYTEIFLCGSAVGVIQSVVSCPMELVKIRAQMDGVGQAPKSRGCYKGSIHMLVKIYKEEKIVGCYRGMVSTVTRELTYGIYFVGYEYLCNQMTKVTGSKNRNMLVSITAGGLTGIMSWTVSFPVDVIKTRLQMDGVNGQQQYRGMMDAFRKSIHRDGWAVLTRGLGTTAARAFPCNAVIFPVVEICLKILK